MWWPGGFESRDAGKVPYLVTVYFASDGPRIRSAVGAPLPFDNWALSNDGIALGGGRYVFGSSYPANWGDPIFDPVSYYFVTVGPDETLVERVEYSSGSNLAGPRVLAFRNGKIIGYRSKVFIERYNEYVNLDFDTKALSLVKTFDLHVDRYMIPLPIHSGPSTLWFKPHGYGAIGEDALTLRLVSPDGTGTVVNYSGDSEATSELLGKVRNYGTRRPSGMDQALYLEDGLGQWAKIELVGDSLVVSNVPLPTPLEDEDPYGLVDVAEADGGTVTTSMSYDYPPPSTIYTSLRQVWDDDYMGYTNYWPNYEAFESEVLDYFPPDGSGFLDLINQPTGRQLFRLERPGAEPLLFDSTDVSSYPYRLHYIGTHNGLPYWFGMRESVSYRLGLYTIEAIGGPEPELDLRPKRFRSVFTKPRPRPI